MDPFRVAFVTGVIPDKWGRRWAERTPDAPLEVFPVDEAEQVAVLHDGRAHMSFVRLPVDREGLHLIPLYDEVPVVVVGKDHPVAAYDEIPVADLADEHLLQDPDDVPEWREIATEVREGTRHPVPPMTLRQAVETVAAGTGVLVVPMSVARVHHRKDVVAVPVTGVTGSSVGLAWRVDLDDERAETFVGIVRGRTERSSRGVRAAPAAVKKPSPERRPGRGRPRRGNPRRR